MSTVSYMWIIVPVSTGANDGRHLSVVAFHVCLFKAFLELGISQIPQLRNLNCALRKLFYHLGNLRCASKFCFASCATCAAF